MKNFNEKISTLTNEVINEIIRLFNNNSIDTFDLTDDIPRDIIVPHTNAYTVIKQITMDRSAIWGIDTAGNEYSLEEEICLNDLVVIYENMYKTLSK